MKGRECKVTEMKEKEWNVTEKKGM